MTAPSDDQRSALHLAAANLTLLAEWWKDPQELISGDVADLCLRL